MKKRAVIGILLILLGIAFLFKPHIEWTGSVTLLALGTIFFLGYLFFGTYGLLVPGGILLGLGSGILAKGHLPDDAGKIVFFALFGAGFLFIYIVDRLKRATPIWPLIPGGILVGIGAYMQADRMGWIPRNIGQYLRFFWPALLILLGIYLILRKK
jgi:hypothetical protein